MKNDVKRYKDIIRLSRPISKKHPPMPISDRAAQFAPFAALTGYGDAVNETARLTDEKPQLDENEKSLLDAKLRLAADHANTIGEICVTYFFPDAKKKGGAYLTVTGKIRRIDEIEKKIIFTDKREIPIEDVLAVSNPHLDQIP